MIRITSAKEGFRRAGVAHPRTPTEYPDDKFSAEELKVLQAEPMLVVETVENPEASKTKAGTKTKDK